LVGSVPGRPSSFRGIYRFDGGLAGSWFRSPQTYFKVDVGGVTAKATVDFARPILADVSALSWSQPTPFAGIARVTNADNLAKWQSVLTFTTIWLGIGGSLLAAFLFETFRNRLLKADGEAAPAAPDTAAVPVRPEMPLLWEGDQA
jgi:hypothetical protein